MEFNQQHVKHSHTNMWEAVRSESEYVLIAKNKQ